MERLDEIFVAQAVHANPFWLALLYLALDRRVTSQTTTKHFAKRDDSK